MTSQVKQGKWPTWISQKTEWKCQRRSYANKGFPHSSAGRASACSAGYPGSIPGSGRSPGEGTGRPLQCSCLENPMHRGARQATVHGVARVGQDWATKPPLCQQRKRVKERRHECGSGERGTQALHVLKLISRGI